MGQKKIRRVMLLTVGVAMALLLIIRGGGGVMQTIRTMQESRAVRTLVIDAGHGGFDGGAVGVNGTAEQDINLSIARSVYALAGFFGMPAAMTREDENALAYDPSRSVRENKAADIKAREKRAQEFDRPVFVSIHLNKFSDPQYHGSQVFYSPNHAGSRVLAEALQNSLTQGCDPSNHRTAKQAEKTIYLMKKLECPAVIVECGFLSNPEEELRLREPDYQKKLAVCILYGCLQYETGG